MILRARASLVLNSSVVYGVLQRSSSLCLIFQNLSKQQASKDCEHLKTSKDLLYFCIFGIQPISDSIYWVYIEESQPTLPLRNRHQSLFLQPLPVVRRPALGLLFSQ